MNKTTGCLTRKAPCANHRSVGAEVGRGARTWPRLEWEWGGGSPTGTRLPASALGACQTPAGSSPSSASPQDKDVASTPWRAVSGTHFSFCFCFPPRKQASRPGWDMGSSTGTPGGVSALACGDAPGVPASSPGPSPGRAPLLPAPTLDQGCEAQAGRLGRNLEWTPTSAPRHPLSLLALDSH